MLVEEIEIHRGQKPGSLSLSRMHVESTATGLSFWYDDVKPISTENLQCGSVDLGCDGLLYTPDQHSDTSTLHPDRRIEFLEWLLSCYFMWNQPEHRSDR
jgi:hypothetical protein